MTGADWRARPAVARFLHDAGRADDSAGIEAAARVLLGDLGWLHATIAALAAAARGDPGRPMPFAAITGGVQQGLVLYDDARVTIALAAIAVDALAATKAAGGGRGSIGFEGALALYRLVDGGDAMIARWEADPIGHAFDARTAAPCRLVGRERLVDGGWLRCDGRHEGFIVEAAARDIVWVQVLVKADRAPLRVEHDAAHHGVIGASAADPAASHAQMLMSLLARTGRADAAPAVARWLDHPAFFVRWHAARTLAAIDPAAGRAAVRRLADDPHPDVAAAARRVPACR